MWRSGTSMSGWVSLLLAVVSADSEMMRLYSMVGDEVVLKPAATSEPITNIIWMFGSNIAMQWDGKEIDIYRQFVAHGDLNTSNGAMTIRRVSWNHGGLYKPEINSVVQKPIQLVVLSPVPKPTISKSCDEEMTHCTLSCDGDSTDGELVSYTWMSDGNVTAWSKKQFITKDNSSSVFTCELKNPVSQESSQPFPNPLITVRSAAPVVNLNISTGVTVFIALLVAVLLLVTVHRCKAGMWFFQKTSMPWEADFWRKQERPPRDAAESNGTTTQEMGQSDEETPMA